MGSNKPSSLEGLGFAISLAADFSARASRIEAEVMKLFEEFRNPLLRYTLSLGLTTPDAEEVVQEVFLALFRHLRLDRSRKNLRSWLFRVAHNLALKRRLGNQAALQREGTGAGVAEEHPDPAPGPEEQVSAAQRHERLRAVVKALPEMDQRCLRLRAEGLRYREIATVLGISLGSVSIALARSLARLVRADER